MTRGPDYHPERLTRSAVSHQKDESLSSSQSTCAAIGALDGFLNVLADACPRPPLPQKDWLRLSSAPEDSTRLSDELAEPLWLLPDSKRRPLRSRAAGASASCQSKTAQGGGAPRTRVHRSGGKGSKTCVFTVNATIDSHQSNRFAPKGTK